MTQDLPPRAADIFRHPRDLRLGSYEGAREWAQRAEVFRRAITLLDPSCGESSTRRIRSSCAAAAPVGVHLHAGDDRDGGSFAH
jgi:hypothetical protein